MHRAGCCADVIPLNHAICYCLCSLDRPSRGRGRGRYRRGRGGGYRQGGYRPRPHGDDEEGMPPAREEVEPTSAGEGEEDSGAMRGTRRGGYRRRGYRRGYRGRGRGGRRPPNSDRPEYEDSAAPNEEGAAAHQDNTNAE